jgi:hypothetical protein
MTMDMNDGFRDLAPLRPRADPDRWASMVAGVERAAAPELARRAANRASDLIGLLSSWTGSAVPAAVAIATAAVTMLVLAERSGPAEPAPGVSDALGFPAPIAAWVEMSEPLSLEEMVLVLEGEPR